MYNNFTVSWCLGFLDTEGQMSSSCRGWVVTGKGELTGWLPRGGIYSKEFATVHSICQLCK